MKPNFLQKAYLNLYDRTNRKPKKYYTVLKSSSVLNFYQFIFR